MNFKKLGNTDLKVSTICLGTMTWGEQNNQKEAFEQMNYALNCGVNFFDAAEIYPSPCKEETYGETERMAEKPVVSTCCSARWSAMVSLPPSPIIKGTRPSIVSTKQSKICFFSSTDIVEDSAVVPIATK